MFGRFREGRTFNFSQGCREALMQAREEANRLGHSYVGTEHILLALVDAPDDEAAAVVTELGLRPNRVRRDVEALVAHTRSTRSPDEELPYTSRAKKALELAMSQARELRQRAVGTGHLLLGLIVEEKGIGAKVLAMHGVSYAAARAAVVDASLGGRKRFSIKIDDASDRSMYEQIIAQFQEGIATGQLAPGQLLPTVRELADDLDIAPGTVARAYSELERLGVVRTDGARGTRVAHREPKRLSDPIRPETLIGLLRPVAVAAFHLGASAPEVRHALEQAMQDIFPAAPPP